MLSGPSLSAFLLVKVLTGKVLDLGCCRQLDLVNDLDILVPLVELFADAPEMVEILCATAFDSRSYRTDTYSNL